MILQYKLAGACIKRWMPSFVKHFEIRKWVALVAFPHSSGILHLSMPPNIPFLNRLKIPFWRSDLSTIRRPIRTSISLFFIGHFLVDNVGVCKLTDGPSMLPTIAVRGQYIYLDRRYKQGRGIKVGDVVDFKHPMVLGAGAVKRVVGQPGDYVVTDGPGEEEKRMIQVN